MLTAFTRVAQAPISRELIRFLQNGYTGSASSCTSMRIMGSTRIQAGMRIKAGGSIRAGGGIQARARFWASTSSHASTRIKASTRINAGMSSYSITKWVSHLFVIFLFFGSGIAGWGSFFATDPTLEAISNLLISASSLGTSTTVYVPSPTTAS